MIATIMPTTAGKKYASTAVAGMGVGAIVEVGAGSTDIAVSANEGQYELEPANVAIIVYCPGMSGVIHR